MNKCADYNSVAPDTRENRQGEPTYGRSIAFMLAVLLVGLPCTAIFSAFWRNGFCMPAAHVAAIFMHVPCYSTPDGFLLAHSSFPVHVTLACSGAKFFVLVIALIVGLIAISEHRMGGSIILAAVILAYCVTIIANSARIITAWYADRASHIFLPPGFHESVHFAAGILVFLVFLTVIYALTAWSLQHDGNS